jgi:hypothetical protein
MSSISEEYFTYFPHKLKMSRSSEIINIKAEINKIETSSKKRKEEKHQQRIN